MQLDGRVVPGAIVQPEIMETTTGLHNGVLEPRLPIADLVFDDPIPFDTADSMLHADAKRRMPLIDVLFQVRKFASLRFLFGLKDGHILQIEALKSGVLR